MSIFKKLTFLLSAVVLSFSAAASSIDEINHLLNFIAQSECIYNRNGSEHKGAEAREHIQKKYDYYADNIKSGEDFIKYSATQSVISGSKYTILCPGEKEQFSGEWLLDELKKYRSLRINDK
ncbi:DUF5329 domain-containing protein [Psychromonas aquimarina]|uniref:DUF5329 family protein n=1 Tax=Psychromonas aquimarina TaxID=444919 RepID=UPI0004227A61|nr:DUF5329 domain-containing protein [Psychromonas aquimarina]